MTTEAPGLPEGVYKRDGKFYHEVPLRVVRDPDGSRYEQIVEREVMIVNPYETDESAIHEAREKAAAKGLDFYDPRSVNGQVIGWLDRGRKRRDEWPENLGSGDVNYKRRAIEPDPSAQQPANAGGRGKRNGE